MKAEVLLEIALIAVLAVFGVRLSKEIRALDSRAIVQQSRAVSSERSAIYSLTGINPSGQVINRLIPPGTKRFVVFGLRGVTIQEDLNFWSGVDALIPPSSGVRLVGFCDGNVCANALQSSPHSSTFPVIAYGDATGSQAIVYADAQGSFILLDGGLKPLSRIKWRSSELVPADIVRQVLR